MIKEDVNTGPSETSASSNVRQKKKATKMKKKVKYKSRKINKDMWLDNVDVMELLNISASTLARRRKSGQIPYVELGGKNYYPREFFEKSMVAKMKNKHLIEKK
ncbi:helix-turn-helix domain-containing protein [Flavobacterium sp.]|uniref:helix-turn-helix domain-containing protein n=1 Tax=Flavobacterium sp. TaxID=239 RepID=UPI0035291574